MVVFHLSDDKEEFILPYWLPLTTRYRVSGHPAHDARLVAWMLANGVGRILTLNPRDFTRYQPAIDVPTVDVPTVDVP